MRIPLVRRAAAGLLAVLLLLPTGARGLEGPDAPPNPPAKPLPPDPPKKVGKEILDALQEFFAKSPTVLSGKENLDAKIARLGASSAILQGMKDWNAKLPEGDSCLRAVAWWKAALASSFTTAQPKVKISQVEVPSQDGKAAPLPVTLNIPPGYRGKNSDLYPVLLTILEKDADGKKVLESTYKPLLETHIVVAVGEDKLGADRTRALRALDWVFSNYRADHHRVALDGVGRGAPVVESLGPEVAVLFNGVSFRGPTTTSDFAGNLGLFPCLAAVPTPAPEPAEAAAEAIKANALAFTRVDGLGTPAADAQILQWIAALPPRRLGDHTATYTWWAGSERFPQKWGYRFFVTQTVDHGPDLPVMVRYSVDPKTNVVDLAAKNLAGCYLFLNDEDVDLDLPVTVKVNGIVVLREAKAVRTLDHLFSSEGLFADPKWPRDHFVTAALAVDVPEEARLTVEERAAKEQEAADALRAAEEAAARARAEAEAKEKEKENEKGEGTDPAPVPAGEGGNGAGDTPPTPAPSGETPPSPPPAPAPKDVATPAEAAALVEDAAAPDLVFLVQVRLPEGSAEEGMKVLAALDEALGDAAAKDLLARTCRIRILPAAPPAEKGSSEAPPATGTAGAIAALRAPALLAFRRGGEVLGTFDGASLKPEEVKDAAVKWLVEKLTPPAAAPENKEPAGDGKPADAGAGGGNPPAPQVGEGDRKSDEPAPAPAPAPSGDGK